MMDKQIQSAHAIMLPEGLSFLCIDDDKRILSLLEAQLASCKPHIGKAQSAEEALAILTSGFKPDVILCDVMMPGADGYSLHGQLRKNSDWLPIPFIYVTALGEESDYRQGMSLGADGYLKKPFKQQELLQEIAHVLLRRDALKLDEKISINLIGAQNVRIGNMLGKAPDRGAEQLVFYLLLQGEGVVKRRLDIMTDLWGNITLSGFRSVLSRAKRWSEAWINWHVSNKTVFITLKTGVFCDLYEIERALSEDDVPKVESLYKGTLLPSYQDDWVVHRREELAERVKIVLLKELEHLASPRARMQALKRLIMVDAHDFDIWDEYIATLEEAGLHGEAKQAREQLDAQHLS